VAFYTILYSFWTILCVSHELSFHFPWASCGVTSGEFCPVGKAETGLVLVDPLGKPVRPELYSDSFRRLTLAARLGVIHLYLVRFTLAVAMDRAGVTPVDAAPPLATQWMSTSAHI
jgi:hypothetical protein